MTDIDVGLSVSEAAARFGFSVHTLRWYEQDGLLPAVARDSAGRRRYHEEDLGWLALLTRLRSTGMPVSDMRRYAELAQRGDATLAERADLFEAHRDRVRTRIAELERDLELVEYKITMYREAAAAQQIADAVPAGVTPAR
jgi:DNA-binding transcriptional MerR regulator